jgi:hypothetical protein
VILLPLFSSISGHDIDTQSNLKVRGLLSLKSVDTAAKANVTALVAHMNEKVRGS